MNGCQGRPTTPILFCFFTLPLLINTHQTNKDENTPLYVDDHILQAHNIKDSKKTLEEDETHPCVSG